MIILYPPPHMAPFARFRLDSSGRELAPDFSKRGAVSVSEAEAIELESEGWQRRSAGEAHVADLRKPLTVDAKRAGITLPPACPDARTRHRNRRHVLRGKTSR